MMLVTETCPPPSCDAMLPQTSSAATTVGLSPFAPGVAPEEQALARSPATIARPARKRGARDIVREPSVRDVAQSVNESRSHCQCRHAPLVILSDSHS